MTWRKVLAIAVLALCLGSNAADAGKGREALVRLKQLPLVGKLAEVQGTALGQKITAAVLAIGIACAGIGCERDHDDGLTREDKRHIQYVNGLLPIQEKEYSTYVHVESKYRNTQQRIVREGDEVYFVQDDGIFGGVVERYVHPERFIVGRLYGTGIYEGYREQKRLVELDLIRGVGLTHHDDTGLVLVMDNDDTIFHRDDDDHIARFYARVANVYNDGFYRVLVEYGTDPQGNRIYLHDSYTLFTHRNIWTTASVPLADHPDLGVDTIVLGPAGSHIEYLLGEVTRVYDDGFYEIEITAELDFEQNHIQLNESYHVYLHESTPLREGGFLLRRTDGF